MTVTKNRKPISTPINGLLNCGKDMDSLLGIKKDFFINQTGAGVQCINDSIDVDYMNEKKAELAAVTATAERDMIEEQHALEEKYFNMDSRHAQLDVSLNCSGHVISTATTADFSIQHDSTGAHPKILKILNCTNKIKSEVSVKCKISNQASLVAVQTVCNSIYGHEYYLTKEEAIENDPSLEELRSESTTPKSPKRSKSKEKPTVAHTTKEWKVYEHVLLREKTLDNHKHVLAIQHKKEAATALYQIQPDTKVTLHFDIMLRNKIDGNFPSLVLIFSDKAPISTQANFLCI